MQVKTVQRKVLRLQKDAEKILRAQMKKYPALQPYARAPYTTYIVRMAVLAPLIIFLGPLLGLIASLGKPHHLATAAEHVATCCGCCTMRSACKRIVQESTESRFGQM